MGDREDMNTISDRLRDVEFCSVLVAELSPIPYPLSPSREIP